MIYNKKFFDQNLLGFKCQYSKKSIIIIPKKSMEKSIKEKKDSYAFPPAYKSRHLEIEENTIAIQHLNDFLDSTANKSPIFLSSPSQTSILDHFATKDPKFIQIYEVKGKSVYKVALNDGGLFALKIAEFEKSKTSTINSLLREYNISRTFGKISENVVAVLDMKQISIGTKIRVEMLMEYCGENLFEYRAKMNPGDALKMSYQLADVLEFMENKGIAHLDIKPGNITWDGSKELLKLIDFGSAVSFYREPDAVCKPLFNNIDRLAGFTKNYCPPELLPDLKVFGIKDKLILQKIDAFSFGITLLELILYEHRIYNFERKRNGTVEDHNAFLLEIKMLLEGLKESHWIELIQNCLSFDIKLRPNFETIKKIIVEKAVVAKIKISPSKKKEGEINYKDVAKMYQKLGEYNVAIWYYENYLEGLSKSASKTNESEFSEIYDNLGLIYIHLKNFKQALKHMREAEILKKKLFGENSIELADIYGNLSDIYLQLEKYKEAFDYCMKNLNLRKKYKLEDDINIAMIYSEFGELCSKTGRYKESIDYFKKSEQIFKAKSIGINEKLGILYSNLSAVYGLMQQFENVIKCALEAEKIKSKVFGSEHPCLSTTYNNLGNAYRNLGQDDKCIEYLRKSEQILLKSYGDDCPELAMIYGNLALAYTNLKKYNDASKFCQKADELRIKIYGNDHASLAYIYNAFGLVFLGQGNDEKAMEYFRKGEKMCLSKSSENSEMLAEFYMNIAHIYAKTRNYKEVITYYSKIEEIYEKLYGKGAKVLLNIYNGLGLAHQELLEYQKAIGYFNKVKLIYEGHGVSFHPSLIVIYERLANSYSKLGKKKEENDCIEKSKLIKSHINPQ